MKINYPRFHMLLLLLLLIFILLSNCVSKKKYEAALQEIARLKVDSTFQEYDQVDAAYHKDSVIYDQHKTLIDQSYAIDSLKQEK